MPTSGNSAHGEGDWFLKECPVTGRENWDSSQMFQYIMDTNVSQYVLELELNCKFDCYVFKS